MLGGIHRHRPVISTGFSLVELVIVVVIIGVIAAIAVPRLGRASRGAGDASYAQKLGSLRRAIEQYRAEHGAYPTCDAATGGRTTIMLQLTQYTDDAGAYSATRTARYRFGPYLREIPALPVSRQKGRAKINSSDEASVGWLYNPTSGHIVGNTATDADASGRLYSAY